MPKLTENVTWQEIDGELVVLDLSRSVYLTTNRTGAFLAKQLRDERDRDELVTSLVAEYGIEQHVASNDVDDFLDQLAQEQLLA